MRTSQANPRILIADDQADVRDALRLLLKGAGFQTEAVASPQAVLTAVQSRDFDAVLMDLNYARDTTSGAEGLELLQQLMALDSTLPVVVLTAWGSVELAVEAMRLGARDFIQKPWDNERLLTILRTQLELRAALQREQRLEAENRLLRSGNRLEMIASAPAMKEALHLITQVAPSDANLLITGEHGTGKEVVARTIYHLSSRASRPMVTVNVGGLPEGVFESELFGHVRGAFTDAKADRMGRFEMADTGTLFLDEIGNLTLSQQAKLLRTLQTGELERVGSSRTRKVDVRILSATNADLHRDVAEGRFRQDLLFRLNTIEIQIPPLRQRREDIPLLAQFFLGQFAGRYRKPVGGFDAAAVQLMLDHSWPGNVRELEHSVERAVLLARGDTVQASDLGLRSGKDNLPHLDEMTLDQAERLLIQKALSRSEGNIHRAAKALGLSRAALYRRLQRYGL